MITDIKLRSNHDRVWLGDYLREKRAKDSSFTVLDVGGAIPTVPGFVPDLIFDINEPQFKTDWIKGSLFDPLHWEEVETWVWEKRLSKYDFAICSHVLEDVRDPLFICQQLVAVAKAGFISVPARHMELARHSGLFRGYIHHRWIFTFDRSGQFVGFPKLPFLEYLAELDAKVDTSIQDLSFFWERDLDLKLVNGDYLGPTPAAVIQYYREGLDDLFSDPNWFDKVYCAHPVEGSSKK